MTAAIDNTTYSKTITKKQSKEGWEDANKDATIGEVAIGTIDAGGTGSVTVSYTKDATTVTLGSTTITVK